MKAIFVVDNIEKGRYGASCTITIPPAIGPQVDAYQVNNPIDLNSTHTLFSNQIGKDVFSEFEWYVAPYNEDILPAFQTPAAFTQYLESKFRINGEHLNCLGLYQSYGFAPGNKYIVLIKGKTKHDGEWIFGKMQIIETEKDDIEVKVSTKDCGKTFLGYDGMVKAEPDYYDRYNWKIETEQGTQLYPEEVSDYLIGATNRHPYLYLPGIINRLSLDAPENEKEYKLYVQAGRNDGQKDIYGAWSTDDCVITILKPKTYICSRTNTEYKPQVIINTTDNLYCRKIDKAEQYRWLFTDKDGEQTVLSSFAPSLGYNDLADVFNNGTYTVKIAFKYQKIWYEYGDESKVIIKRTLIEPDLTYTDNSATFNWISYSQDTYRVNLTEAKTKITTSVVTNESDVSKISVFVRTRSGITYPYQVTFTNLLPSELYYWNIDIAQPGINDTIWTDATGLRSFYTLARPESLLSDFRIVSQRELTTHENTPVELDMLYFHVVNSPANYPDGCTLEIQAGEHYTMDNLTLIPEDGFTGTLSVPVRISSSQETTPWTNSQIAVVPTPWLDLIPHCFQDIDTKSYIEAGETFTVNYTVENLGTGYSSEVFSEFYLLTDTTGFASMQSLANDSAWRNFASNLQSSKSLFYIAGDMVSSIVPSCQEVCSSKLKIPFFNEEKNCFMLCRVDAAGRLAESNESNNFILCPIKVVLPAPDLALLSVSLSDIIIEPQEDITFTTEIANYGRLTSDKTLISVYYSKDTVFSGGDIPLPSILTENILPNDSTLLDSNFKIPSFVKEGTAFLLFIIDPNDNSGENNKQNNLYYQSIEIVKTKPDLQFSSNQTENLSLEHSYELNFDEYIANYGNAVSDNCLLTYYLSNDSIFDSADNPIYSIVVDSIEEKSTIHKNIVFPLNSELTAGKWYVFGKIDANEILEEINEEDNFIVRQFVMPSIPHLVVTSIEVDTCDVYQYSNHEVTSVISNFGNTTSQSCSLSYYLSYDTVYQHYDIKVPVSVIMQYDTLSRSLQPVFEYKKSLPGLVNGSTFNSDDTLYFTSETPVGSWYLLSVASDVRDTLTLENCSSIAWMPISIRPARPELSIAIESVSQSEFVAGKNTTVAVNIINSGFNDASELYSSVYLSSDSILDSSDMLLKNTYTDRLNARDTLQTTISILLPFDISPGTYYLIAKADAINGIVENDETNNCSAIPVYVLSLPDLVLKSLTQDTIQVHQGGNIELNLEAGNIGNAKSVSTKANIYLSSDTVLDESDLLINQCNVSRIEPGLYRTCHTNLHMPNDSVGRYYLIYSIGIDSTNTESDYSNNTSYAILDIRSSLPDIFFANIISDKMASYPGGQVHITTDIGNQGYDNAKHSKLRYYLSTDTIYSSEDKLLNEQNIAAIRGDEYKQIDKWLYIAGNTPVGQYYLLLVADATGLVNELSEANNLATIPLWIATDEPDLETVLWWMSDDVVAGNQLGISFGVFNRGDFPSTESNYSIYLSQDSIFDLSDSVLVNNGLGSLYPGQGNSAYQSINISASLAPGDYYIFIVADPSKQVKEINEYNNIVAKKILVRSKLPDLVVNSIKLNPEMVFTGSNLNISATVTNIGGSIAPTTRLKYFLSSDTTLDVADMYIGSDYVWYLWINQSSNNNISFELPLDIKGNQYILCYADAEESLVEYNEYNIFYKQILFESKLPDLEIMQLELNPKTILNGDVYVPYIEIANTGYTPSPANRLSIYFYNTLHDTVTVLSEYIDIKALEPNEKISKQLFLYLDSLPVGNYSIKVIVDSDNNVDEANEFNNSGIITCTVANPYPDLVIDNFFIEKDTIEAGFSSNLCTGIKNTGFGAAGQSHLNFYLSIDSVVTDAGILNLQSVANLPVQGTRTLNSNVVIPPLTEAGKYYIIAYADGHAEVRELAEDNNTCTKEVYVTNNNDIPEITDQYGFSVYEDDTFNINIRYLKVNDPDNIFPDDFQLSFLAGENYTVSDGKIIPEKDFFGKLNVLLRIYDGQDYSEAYSFIVNVVNQNDPPKILEQQELIYNEDTFFKIELNDVLYLDVDNTISDLRLKSFNGEHYFVKDNTIYPDSNYFGNLTVPVRLYDLTDSSEVFVISITINPVNDIPVIASVDALQTNEQTPLEINLLNIHVTDVDNQYPNDFTFAIQPGNNYSVNASILIPDNGFIGNLTVGITVNDGVDDSKPYSITIPVIQTIFTLVWTGAVDTNWDNPANWQPNRVPDAEHDVVIPAGLENYPATTGTNSSIAQNIQVAPGAYITIPQGTNLTLTGQIVLQADTARVATIVDYNTTNSVYCAAGAIVQLPVKNDSYQLIAVPNGAKDTRAIGDIVQIAFWHEPTSNNTFPENDAWNELCNASLKPGIGYAAWFETSETISYSSNELVSGDITVPVTKLASSDYRGWNLIGNPYPSAIDAIKFININMQNGLIQNKILVYDPIVKAYATISPAGNVPASTESAIPDNTINPGQAFWVFAKKSGDIVFNNNMRKPLTEHYYRQEDNTSLLLASTNESSELKIYHKYSESEQVNSVAGEINAQYKHKTLQPDIYAAEKTVYIRLPEMPIGSTVEIFDVTGKCITKQKLTSDLTKIPLINRYGLFMVRLSHNNEIYNKKILIF